MILEVVFPVGFAGSLNYILPEEKVPFFLQKSPLGFRVVAPLRNQKKEGIIVGFKNEMPQESEKKLKEIITIVDDFPLVSKDAIVFTRWVAEYYFSSWGALLFLALPPSIRLKIKKDASFSNPIDKNIKQEYYQLKNQTKNTFKKNSKKEKLLELFLEKKKLYKKDILQIAVSPTKIIKELMELSIIEKKKETIPLLPLPTLEKPKIQLTPAQLQVIQQCEIKNKFIAHLLFGVSASGKTEIYIFLMWQVLQKQKSALFLVPEIALIPQTKSRIEKYFPSSVFVWHSSITASEKLKIWWKIKNQHPCILLGTRSALFLMPFKLGLIVIDEEQDSSLRQIENPTYNARDSAYKLAQQKNIPIVLGSATPSIESYRNSKLGKSRLLLLQQKYRPSNNKVELVDLKTANKYQGIYYFSQELYSVITETLAKKEQCILFVNHKGFASFIQCKSCQQVLECDQCSVPLTWYRKEKKLLCHHCNKDPKEDIVCKNCQSRKFSLLGIGIEKLAELLQSIFPQARILQLDRSSIDNNEKLKNSLELIKKNEVDIIVGTQMIVKGHHFANVTLCGVLLANTNMQQSEHRNSEKIFQLLVQLLGRAGREISEARTIIQTYEPESPVIKYAIKQDFISFYQSEIEKRKAIEQPPIYRWVIIKICSKKEENAKMMAEKIYKNIKKNQSIIDVFSPIESSPYKSKNWYYWEIVLQSKTFIHLKNTILKSNIQKFNSSHTRVKIIVDP